MDKRDRRIGKKTVLQRTVPEKDDVLPTPAHTMDEALEYFVQIKRAANLKDRTIQGYVQNMRYFIEWLTDRYGQMNVNDVTVDILREYIVWCATEKPYYDNHPFKTGRGRKGLSAASVNVRIRVLKVFFNTLYKEDLINTNPAENISLMRQDIDTIEPLTDEELHRLLKAPDKRYFAQFRDYVIMTLILDTGIRLNEICSLEIHEIDFTRKRITLPASKNKNRRSRILPLSTETARLLRQLVKETAQYFDTNYVFTTNYGEPVNEKTIQKALSQYGEKAKITKRVTPHVLRHTFATMAAHNGMSIFHLQKILGHADITTTRKYVQVSDNELTEQHMQFSPIRRLKRGGSK